MSKSVEELAKQSTDVANLVVAQKELYGTSMMMLMVLALGAHPKAVDDTLAKFKAALEGSQKALKPFEAEAA